MNRMNIIMTGYVTPTQWKSKPNLCLNPWPAV